MHWTWDQAKNEANLRAHGLGFKAAFVFDDPLSAIREDPFPSEQLRRTIGMVGIQVVMVVYTWPELDTETGEETGRKAPRREREAYEEGYY